MKAIALDGTDARAYARLGWEYANLGDYDRAMPAFEQAFSLNPNDPDVLVWYGEQLVMVGRAREGVAMIDRANRLNPRQRCSYDGLVDPYSGAGQYDQVITRARRLSAAESKNPWIQMVLAMSYEQLGRHAEAEAVSAELSQFFLDCSFERILSEFGGIPDKSVRAEYLDGARKAGLRDCATPEELQKYPKMTHLAACDAKRATK